MAISDSVSRYVRGGLPEIYGGSKQTRDLTNIADVVDDICHLLTDNTADDEKMTIGLTAGVDIRTLLRVMHNEIDPSPDVVRIDRGKGDTEHAQANISKANDLIDYAPSRDICEGVGMFIDWHRQNRDWYKPLILNSQLSDLSGHVSTQSKKLNMDKRTQRYVILVR